MRAEEDIAAKIGQKASEGLKDNGAAFQILVVDDSATMRKIVGQHLKTEAYEICGEASSGTEAVTLYKELKPDAVTLDINMPGMDGLAALKGILEFDGSACVIMLTSEGQRETVIEAIKMGAKGYLVKPPDKTRLCEKMKFALNG